MEKQLFTWKIWEEYDMIHEFEGVTLVVPIAEHPAGTKFGSACIDYDDGTLELRECPLGEGGKVWQYTFGFTVTPIQQSPAA